MTEPNEQSSKSRGSCAFWILPFLVIFLLWLIAPVLITTENATVYIGDCFDKDCAMKGTLSTNIFTRNYELEREDGSVIVFSSESVNLMSWPAPEK